MSGPLRYARRLLVVAALVAAVIGLGFLWRSSSAASLVADDRGGAVVGVPNGRDHGRRNDHAGMSLSNISDLGQTTVIGVGVLAAVVVIDRGRRKRNPIRR